MALCARPGDVLRLVIRRALLLAVLGIALGVTAAFGATRLMESLLFQTSANDAMTFCWYPAGPPGRHHAGLVDSGPPRGAGRSVGGSAIRIGSDASPRDTALGNRVWQAVLARPARRRPAVLDLPRYAAGWCFRHLRRRRPPIQ
jgi:hypothetical protein